VLDVVRELAEEKNATPVQISLSWLLHKDVVTAPIIGPKTVEQLEENLGALDIELTGEELVRLEEPIEPAWAGQGT